jgi:hypothetical protein
LQNRWGQVFLQDKKARHCGRAAVIRQLAELHGLEAQLFQSLLVEFPGLLAAG